MSQDFVQENSDSSEPARIVAPPVVWQQGVALGWWMRLFLVGMSLGLATLLVVARLLEPSPSGLGTHQQLGLPPCTFRVLWGIECPMCGMTTSWSHLTRGMLIASFQASIGGALLGLTSLVAVPLCLYFAWTGVGDGKARLSWLTLIWLTLVLVIITVQWTVRLTA